jgi:hypothetical protein
VLNYQIHRVVFLVFLGALITIQSFLLMSTTATKFRRSSPIIVGQNSSNHQREMLSKGVSGIQRGTGGILGSLLTESFVHERSKILTRLIQDDRICMGPHNGRTCQVSKINSTMKIPNKTCSPRAPQRRTPPTPWATLGNMFFYANDYLDLIVFDIFFKYQASQGFYVEIGGSNGIHAANTLFFDDCLGWKGIITETSECARCELPFNRPTATIEHVAIGKLGDSFDAREMSAAFCNSCPTDGATLQSVACSTVQVVLDKHNITRVDFISIDVESQSEFALESIEFFRMDIGVVLVECRLKERCEKKLISAGFKFVWIGADVLGWNPLFFGNASRSVEQEYFSMPISFTSLQPSNLSNPVSQQIESQDTQIVKLALQMLRNSPSNSNWLCLIVLNQAYLGLFENWMCSLHRFKATEVVMPSLAQHTTYIFLASRNFS